jgi:hypothetical protein
MKAPSSLIFTVHKPEPKIRYYKDVPLCENYVRDFFIAAILPVSVKFNHWSVNSTPSVSKYWKSNAISLAAILAVSENYGHANIREIRRVAHLYSI